MIGKTKLSPWAFKFLTYLFSFKEKHRVSRINSRGSVSQLQHLEQLKTRGYVVQVLLIASFGKVVTLTVTGMTQIMQKCQAILGNVTFPLKNARKG